MRATAQARNPAGNEGQKKHYRKGCAPRGFLRRRGKLRAKLALGELRVVCREVLQVRSEGLRQYVCSGRLAELQRMFLATRGCRRYQKRCV